MTFAFYILIAAISPPALAGNQARDAKVYVACEDPATLEPKIRSCTDNVIAEKAAAACRAALVAEWNRASAELTAIMSVSQKSLDTKQQADFNHSHSDMQLAIDRMANLIILTEESADKLAQYPRIMFDNPYAAAGLEGSSSCYKDSFLAIGRVVKDLDKKADEGEDALAATDKLRGVSQARDDGIGTSLNHSVASRRSVGIGAGAAKISASDVTGVEQDKAKQRGAAAPGTTATVSAVHFNSRASGASAGLNAKIDPSGSFSGRGSLSTGAGAQVGDANVPTSPGDAGISSETNLLNAMIPGEPRVPASPDRNAP
jgi:hypothetical protein